MSFLYTDPPSSSKILYHTSHAWETGTRICDYPEGPIKAGAKESEGSSSLKIEPLAFSFSQQSLE